MTVHEKLDRLLAKAVITQVVLVGSLGGNGTISATALENYQSLTADDFMIVTTQVNISSSGGSSGNGSGSSKPALTYNAETGVITVTGAKIQPNSNLGATLYVSVYYIVK